MPGTDPPTMSAVWRRSGIAFTGSELAVCGGICLARMAKGDRLALAEDRERLETLLAIGYRRPLSERTLVQIEVATEDWRHGDCALANLRLLFADLPPLDAPGDAARLEAAAWLLDAGVSPQTLMKELGLQSQETGLRRYDPDQPRVPVGSGRESGRWSGGGVEQGATSFASAVRLHPTASATEASRSRPRIVQVVADGPFEPRGLDIVPLTGSDPLDPMALNKPLAPEEQQAIADTINAIVGARPESLRTLNPHVYLNLPDHVTGARLPPLPSGYVTYYVRKTGSPAGSARLIVGSPKEVYYTNNHYRSFYPVDLKVKAK